jgi:putative hydrolase
VEPLDALNQIAFRLERSGADTYKVRAFRNAARAVADVDTDTLRQLAAAGRLQSLEGVGKSTALVIAQALDGKTPDRLTELQEAPDDDLELDGPAQELLASLRGDCHSHSDWSDGGSPIREMAEAARDLGHEYLVLTDHSARLTVAHGLNAERLRAQLDVLAELNDDLAPFRILTGIEVDILEDGSLDQELDLLAELDVVVASVHSKLRMEEPAMTERMLAAIESPHTDILGHCTGRLITGRGRPQSTFDAEAVFGACARTGTAVEINSRPERQDPPQDLLRQAVSLGCSFAVDTDAHAPGQLGWLGRGCAKAVDAAVPPARIVNRASADDLLAWAGAHS